MVKLLKLCLASFLSLQLFAIPSSINAADDANKTETVFSNKYLDGSTKIENTNDGKIYVQDFKKIVEEPTTRANSSETLYKVVAGRQILTEAEYQERQNEPKTRATLTDSWEDGRGTNLYIEIVYSVTKVNGDNAATFKTLYCNSSGSTLSAYSVTYGVTGTRQDTNVAYTRTKSEKIDTTLKTFDKNIESTMGWPPMYFGPGNELEMGATQYYTCRGYSNHWSVSI